MKPIADLILQNGRITTLDPRHPSASEIVIVGDKITGAAIDVFDVEPLPPEHPFRSLENALATPHIGYVSRELFRTFYGDTVRNIAEWLDQRTRATERTSSI